MALSDSLDLSISAALAQIGRVDKALDKALSAHVDLDTKLAATKIAKLRQTATDAFRKQLVVNVNTNEARLKLIKLDTQVKEIRKRIQAPLQFNVGIAQAERKLAQLHRAAVAVRNQITGATNLGAGKTAAGRRTPTESEAAQRSLNSALTRYNTIVPASIVYAQSFTDVLRNQAIQAGILAGELRAVAGQAALFKSAVSSSAFGLSNKQQFGLNQSLGQFGMGGATSATEKQLFKINNALSSIGKNPGAQQASQKIKQLGFDAQSINQQFIAAGRTLTTLFTLPTVVAAAFAAFNEFKFQETINRIRVLTDAFKNADGTFVDVTKRTEALREQFNKIAALTGQTPQSVAEGFYFVASAGGEAATRMSILRVAAQGAAIGLGTVEVVADSLTSVLNAYGEANITAAEAGDILVRAVNDAKVEADEFAPQLGRILPIAKAVGIEFATVASALATLTQNGNSASVASTQLRGIFQTLVRPTSQKAADILASVGLDTASIRQSIEQGGPTGLIDALAKLRYESGLSLEELSQLFRRVDAFNGFLALTDDAEATRTAILGVAEAGKNVTGNLEEFEAFAQRNDALKLRQGFAQLLAQLQPLGQRVLPLVVKGIGGAVIVFDRLAALLDTPILGGLTKFTIASLAVAGPLLAMVGRLRQVEQAFRRLQIASQFRGGVGQFLSGESGLNGITVIANQANQKTTLLSRSLGALPGLFGLGAGAATAFFAGSALGAEGLENKLLGLAGTLGAVAISFKSMRSLATAFGASAGVAGGLGAAAGALVAGIALWQAYETATSKSRKALEEFQGSLEGFTANESIENFAVSLGKSLEGITADDHVTKVEIPELREALEGLGLSYEELGQRLANIVFNNPDDLDAQRLAIARLGKEVAEVGGDGRIDEMTDAIALFNDEIARGAVAALGTLPVLAELEAMGKISDETRDRFLDLLDAGEITFGADGLVSLSAGAKASLDEAFGDSTVGLLDKLAEAFRRARQVALDTTGEFTTSTNAAGAFIETLDEDGESVLDFAANVDEVRESMAGLREEFDKIIARVFGLADAIDEGRLRDNLTDVRGELLKKVQAATPQFELDDKGVPVTDDSGAPTPNEQFINFKVDIQGADGQPVRKFIRDALSDIDAELLPFFTGPDANIELGLKIRDEEIATLAAVTGLTVADLNAFLAADPSLSTVELRTALEDANVSDIQNQMAVYQKLIDDSPLEIGVKAKILAADADEQTALFGSSLLNKALQGGSAEVIDFVINAQSEGVDINTLQNVFGDADQQVVKSIVVQAIQEGTPIEEISALLAAIPADVRRQLTVALEFETQQSSDPDVAFLLGDPNTQNRAIKVALEGADEIETLLLETAEGSDMVVTVDPEREEFDSLVAEIEAGNSFLVSTAIERGSYNAMLAEIRAGVRNAVMLSMPQSGGRGNFQSERGGMFSGGIFRSFALGGVTAGHMMPRAPMVAMAPRGSKGILWGEPGTHGESYVPWNPVHRGGAIKVMQRTADQFGYELVEKARRGPGRMAVAERGGYIETPMSSASFAGGRGVATLAAEVARLAEVVSNRETQPLIGQFVSQRPVGDDRAAARYWASDINAAAARANS